MPTYRQIHVKIWKDGWFLDLPSDHKLLFIYLFSNERANLFGLYDLPLKVICFETELDPDTVTEGLARFTEEGKAFYEDGWVWVRSLLTYNAPNLGSPKIQGHLQNVLAEIPDIPLKARALRYYARQIPYTSDTDTASIPDRTEQEQETEQETEHDQEQHQQQEMDVAVAAVQAMEAHGMTGAEKVLRETDLSPAQLIETVAYAKAHDLGAGWVRSEVRENRAHSPPQPEPEYARFMTGDYADVIER